MTESEWAVWCLSCASTWLGASPYGALPLAVPVGARLQRREILQRLPSNRRVSGASVQKLWRAFGKLGVGTAFSFPLGRFDLAGGIALWRPAVGRSR